MPRPRKGSLAALGMTRGRVELGRLLDRGHTSRRIQQRPQGPRVLRSRAAAAADDARAESEPPRGLVDVRLGRQLLGEPPAVLVLRKTQVAVREKRRTPTHLGEPLEISRQPLARGAVDAERFGREKQEPRGGLLEGLAREKP